MVNKAGYTLPEMLISTALTVFLVATVFLLMASAQGAFFNADTSIDIRNQLRVASQKIAYELKQSGYNAAGTAQFIIADGTGTNSTDVLTFSTPVLCDSSLTTILNSSGDPAYWGAPLTWGCTTASCMDANNSCAALEYKYIRYKLDNSNNLLRQVLDVNYSLVAETIVANNIVDFQLSLPNGGNGRVITVVIAAQKQSSTKRVMNVSVTKKVMVANYGS